MNLTAMVFTHTGCVTLLICLLYTASVAQAAYRWEPTFLEVDRITTDVDRVVFDRYHIGQLNSTKPYIQDCKFGVVSQPAFRYILNVFHAMTNVSEWEAVHNAFVTELERRGLHLPEHGPSTHTELARLYEVFMATWMEAVFSSCPKNTMDLLYARAQYSALHKCPLSVPRLLYTNIRTQMPYWPMEIHMDDGTLNKPLRDGDYRQVIVTPRTLVWDGQGISLVFVDTWDYPAVVMEGSLSGGGVREIGSATLWPAALVPGSGRPDPARPNPNPAAMKIIGEYTPSRQWDTGYPTVGPPRRDEPPRDASCGMTKCGASSMDGLCAELTCRIASPRRALANFCVLNTLYEYAPDYTLRETCSKYIDDDEGLSSAILTKARPWESHTHDDNGISVGIIGRVILFATLAFAPVVVMIVVCLLISLVGKKLKELEPPRPSGTSASADSGPAVHTAAAALAATRSTAPLLDTTPRETLWNGADGCEDGVRYQPPLISVCVEVGSDNDGSPDDIDIEVKMVPVTGGEW